MSRRRKGPTRSVTVFLDDELVVQLDQWQNSFGIETRGLAAAAMMRAGGSAVPLDTAVFEISQASVKEIRKAEIDALVAFFESRSAIYRGHRR